MNGHLTAPIMRNATTRLAGDARIAANGSGQKMPGNLARRREEHMPNRADSANLCAWPWWKKVLFPRLWCAAENAARDAKWKTDLAIARAHGIVPPPPPNWLIIKP